jgi:mannosyltransferase OCH1-like enzyme
MIPKIIHYCWFGNNELSDLEKMCISSWEKYCPDYSIKLWNELNSPMDHSWVRESYRHKKFAFVSDYVRFYALNNEGGIYLDTDMLLVKNIDNFLIYDFFIGYEDDFTLSMGIIGAQKGNVRISHFQKFYDEFQVILFLLCFY